MSIALGPGIAAEQFVAIISAFRSYVTQLSSARRSRIASSAIAGRSAQVYNVVARESLLDWKQPCALDASRAVLLSLKSWS